MRRSASRNVIGGISSVACAFEFGEHFLDFDFELFEKIFCLSFTFFLRALLYDHVTDELSLCDDVCVVVTVAFPSICMPLHIGVKRQSNFIAARRSCILKF